jgi:hypothetical protein
MDLQLLVAINLMSLSALAIIVILMQRSTGYRSWVAAHAFVLLVGAVALVWSPQWSGVIVAVAFVPLVFVPGLLVSLAQRYALSNQKRKRNSAGGCSPVCIRRRRYVSLLRW